MEAKILKETIHFGAPRVTKMRKFPCEICYKLFTKNFLKVHFEAVHHDKNYKCSICNKEYMEERGLKQHVDSMHEGKKDHQCNLCNKSFTRKDSLQRHNNVNHLIIDYKCDTCDVSFTRVANLKKHLYTVHEGRKDYKCDVCHNQNF